MASSSGTSVTVHNVAPVINGSITGPTIAVPGQPLAYSAASFSDVGTQDTHTITWEVRDGANAVVATGSGPGLNFTPTTVGTYSVAFRVTDDDGGSATTSLALSVGYASLQVGVCSTGEGTALVVGSLTVADRIHVNPQGNNGTLQVTITNRLTDTVVFQQTVAPPAGGFAEIVIFGQAADDYIQISDSINVAACIHAGAGNDNVKGGGGNDLILGGDGNDDLIGGKGRDLIIGGRGADRIVGNNDDDILVAGFTAYDDDSHALAHILKEWTSGATYASRVANIKNGGGLTEGFRFNGDDGASQTVFNDNDADTLTGSSSLDAFWANLVADNGGALDKITDLANGESGSDTDF